MDTGCLTCERSRSLLDDLSLVYPDLDVKVIEVEDGQPLPSDVVAVPTFVLDGRVISIGNPTLDELLASVKEAVPKNA